MDLDPRSFFLTLNENVNNDESGAKECKKLLISLNDTLVKQQLSPSIIDLYLLHMFNDSHGLIQFIKSTLNKKPFEQSVTHGVEILYTLVNNFPGKLEKHVVVVNNICLQILKTSRTSASQKVKALDVVNLSFQKIDKHLDNPEHYSEIYDVLLNSFAIKKSTTVRERLLFTIGTFAKQFPYNVKDPEQLKTLFLSQINHQMLQPEPCYGIVSGAFTGLTSFCEGFPLDEDMKEDKVIIGQLHQFINKLATPTTTVRVAHRAALSFLTQNISLFIPIMIENYLNWHSTLLKWLSSSPEDQKVGFSALEAFYKGLAKFLTEVGAENHPTVVVYFLNYYKTILKKEHDVSNYEKRLCFRGLCAFSSVYHIQLSSSDIKSLFTMVIQNFEQSYVLNSELDADQLEFLPDYVETLSNLMHFKKISNSEIFCLQRGVINMIKTFPQFPLTGRICVVDALVSTFHYLKSNNEKTFINFVDNTVYQGVVWSCSHRHLSEAELSGSDEKIITVKDYWGLWKGLLSITSQRKYDKNGIYLNERKYLLVKIVNKLVKTLLLLIHKLNVSVVLIETDATDIQSAYKAAKIDDISIFLNVVDLYQDIFSLIEPNMLKKCICRLIKHLLTKCVQDPFISGFYKLLSYCLKMANKLNHFEQVNIDSVQDIKECFELLKKYLGILLTKVKQFKDDLLIACLQLLLEYPPMIIKDMLPACVPAFISIFYVGRSYIKLADLGVDTLEHWQNNLPKENMEQFLIEIIPYLDSYLQSKSLGALNQQKLATNQRKTQQALKKRKVLIEIEPELIKLQKKMLKFIGQQNSKLCQSFVNSDHNIELAVWSNQQHLKIVLPYQDVKLEIYLDKLIPRVINLALHSSDRKTRITACELLQAMTMVFLGVAKQMSQSGLSDLNELLRHMTFPLLKLACDLDHVVQQLFQPLFFQLIHWYTFVTQLRGEHSAIIIEAIMDGITHPTDSALRDFSGQCVNEFVKWTIKQTTEAHLARDPLNVKVLIKKMRFFSLHPDPAKKLGAAMIFNNIYKDVREERALLNIFWIECLHIFVKSLSMIEYAENDDNTVVQIGNALNHIQRGFVEKANLFNDSDKSRRVPFDIKGDLLQDVAIWIFKQTGSKSPYCREKCMELFVNITPRTKGYQNLQQFVAKHFSEDYHGWIPEIYEKLLTQSPTLSSLSDNESANLLKWMQALLQALDGYNFILKNHLVAFINLPTAPFISAVNFFMGKMALSTMQDNLMLISDKLWITTTFERQEFDRQKTQAFGKIVLFLNTLLNDEQCKICAHQFCTIDLWMILLNFIFKPRNLGFDPFSTLAQNDKLNLLLKDFLKKLPADKTQDFVAVLNNYIDSNSFIDIDLKRNVPLDQRNFIKGLLFLESCNVLDLTRFKTDLVDSLLSKFIVNVENDEIYADDLQDTTLTHCLLILDLALQDEEELQKFIEFLYKPHKIHSLENIKPISFGSYILLLFKDVVIQKLVENFEIFVNTVIGKKSMVQTMEFIFHILDYVSSKREFKQFYEYIIKNLLFKWEDFEAFFMSNSLNIEIGISFVKYLLPLMRATGVKDEQLKKWLYNLLSYEESETDYIDLNFKIDIFDLIVEILDIADDENEDLRSALLSFKENIFSDLSELSQDTKIIFLNKLLPTIPKIKTPELLRFLLEILIKISTEENDIDVKDLLTLFITKNSEGVQEKTLWKIYKICCDDELNIDKYKLMINITILFQRCQDKVFEKFAVEHVSNMMAVLREPTDTDNLINKTIQFMLVELVYLRCTINTSDSTIKNLRKDFMKLTLDACKDSPALTKAEEKEILRLYKCHSYNAAVSIVSNSKDYEKLYGKLFVRQENNIDVLWKGLIDVEKTYVFESAFDNIPKRRKVLVNIRDTVKAQKQLENSQFQSVKYAESMRVYNSSLSEDFSKFDFTNAQVRSQDGFIENPDVQRNVQSEVELDSVDVNKHECMANVCALIQHIVNTGFVKLPEEKEEDYVLPAWIKDIRNLLLSENTDDNVKIFWVKVIDNTAHIFKHLAKWFLEPLLKFVVDKCAGDSFNYFVTDVVAILASWSTSNPLSAGTETALASKLLCFLITHINNERQDMFKYHLDLIKLLIESWKVSLEIPYDLIFAKFDVDLTSKKVEIGIHIASILLANKIAPWSDANLAEFCKKIFTVVNKIPQRTIYRPGAETIGLMLNFLKNHDYLNKLLGNIQKFLKNITDNDRYAYVLEGIVLHYPQIADEFHITRLLSKLHIVPSNLKIIYLKVILKRADILDRVAEFKCEPWENYLGHEKAEVQILALEVIYKSWSILWSCPIFKTIMKSVIKHVLNPNDLCRSRMYDIAISICESGGEGKYGNVFHQCRDLLIQGLIDADFEIRDKVFHFWKTSAHLPVQLSRRFPFILNNLYKTNTENDFLGYSSYFLLDTIRNSDEYKEVIFEHPLEDCEYQDYELQTNWRVRHLSVVPMFAETLRSFNDDFASLSQPHLNELRQTQTSQFSFAPTQSMRMRQLTQYTMSESSLFINTEDSANFVNPNLVPLSQKYRVPKKRFLKDKWKLHRFFANQEIGKSVKTIEQRKNLVKEGENKVNIYRKYRTGDLPDIQITLQAILEPLQALALHDGEISKILYLEMFKSILNKMEADSYFINEISTGIKHIFNNSTQLNTNLIRTLLDVVLLNKQKIIIEPNLITTVAQSSGLINLGILLLEEYLLSYDAIPSTSKKSRGVQEDGEVTYWIKLASLYKEIDEWDVVKAIFLEKTDCKEHVQEALLFESQKAWKDAQDLYKTLIETDESLEKKDFYYESYFKCFAHLGDWENLYKAIDVFVSSEEGSSWNNLWDQDWNQQKLLPWYINAQVKNALFNGHSSSQFLSNLNESLNSDNADYLHLNFSEELAALWIFQGRVNMAGQYVNLYVNNFLDSWQILDPLYSTLRYNKLMKLHNIVDISSFIEIFENLTTDSENEVKELINYWRNSLDESLPSILLSETRFLYRKQFISLLKKRIEAVASDDLNHLLKELDDVKVQSEMNIINSAIEDENFSIAKKYIGSYDKKNMSSRFKFCLSALSFVKFKMAETPESKLDCLIKGSNVLAPILENNDYSLKFYAHLQFFKNIIEISKLSRENHDLIVDNLPKIGPLTGNAASASDIAKYAVEKLHFGLTEFEKSLSENMEVENTTGDSKDHVLIANAYLKLAYFVQERAEYSLSFISFVLQAMKFHSVEAQQLFPCILMRDLNEEETALFVEKTETIPIWMFLGWIPQILVAVDSVKISAVAPIILKIANFYPQAIMYAYRLSRENYKLDDPAFASEAKVFIEKLDQLLLSDARIDMFLRALSSVGVPEAILMYYLRKLVKAYQAENQTAVKNIQENVLSEVFACMPDSRSVESLQGNMFKDVRKYEKTFKNISGESGKDMTVLRKVEAELRSSLSNTKKIKNYSKLLKDYCPWLGNFSAEQLNLDLEIPGQYDGKKLPLTQHHVKISSFCPNVTVISSLRKPIKITILGNDTKEYPFLIKFGEDIRQDQRIQQLFSLMNNIFTNDKIFNQHQALIKTFQVIPLTTKLGIIQWIEDTESLSKFIEKALKDKSEISSFQTVLTSYKSWIYKSTNVTIDAYGHAALNYSRDKTIAKFRSLVNAVPWDILRTAFWKLSVNTEGFSALRSNFIKTYAVICLSHWILGIGDRHLDNCLICTKTGKVLGIDFGHAFGTATQILPVPELVPFRLTPHIVNLMAPLGENGLFKRIMVHCLRSLRMNSDSLLATMNVFIKEPSIDWIEHAATFEDSPESGHDWYPMQKIDQAKRKLNGASSVAIMVEDLRDGHSHREAYMNAYVALVKGSPETNVRARKIGDYLSVEDQVDCLIDHATDFNLLGRMFEGWSAWV